RRHVETSLVGGRRRHVETSLVGGRRRHVETSLVGVRARAKSKQSVEMDSEERLLQQMLELDNAYEAGKVKKSEYEQRRAKLKARLRVVMGEKVMS
ncbi:MAG: hypothetical protein WCD86_07840, partial [Ktedonobacteraceae bacterium]